jgi:hypothetical protein
MKNIFAITALLLILPPVLLLTPLVAQAQPQSPARAESPAAQDITGLYSFVHEGEFVEIEVNDGKVTGLVSRFKDDNSEKPEFVEQFFDQASLDGATLSFRTKPSDGVLFEFSGIVERGPARTPGEEGYWTVRGTLTERRPSAQGIVSVKTQKLTLKSFPQDTDPDAPGGAPTRDKSE